MILFVVITGLCGFGNSSYHLILFILKDSIYTFESLPNLYARQVLADEKPEIDYIE